MDKQIIKSTLDDVFQAYKDHKGGKNADYIPYLAQVPSHLCGAVVVTTQGDVFTVGDYDYPFAIESISKVCTLGLVMEQSGSEAIRKKVGDSPTGLPFNSVMALELHQDKPLSPLVNAGAMASTSLVKATSKEDRWQQILAFQQKIMSPDVKLSDDVNTSEQTTNFHNRAIAWLLYSAGQMYCDPMEACEVYTQQCSTLVTAKDLALLAGTLANGGVHPLTKEKVVAPHHVPHILAEMMMEGLYDGSGDWAYTVGLPGKSGVGGGLIAVVPGQLGIAAFSPPLDAAGNSVRGQKIIHGFAHKLKLNLFTP